MSQLVPTSMYIHTVKKCLPEDNHMQQALSQTCDSAESMWGAWGCGSGSWTPSHQGEVQRNLKRYDMIVSEKCYRQGQIPSFSRVYSPLTPPVSFSLFQPQEHLASLPPSLTCFSGPWAPINGTSWKMLMQAVCLSSLPISWPGKTVCLSCLISQRIDKFAACNKSITLNPCEPLRPCRSAMGIFFTDTAQHITKRMSNTQ